MKTLNDLVGYKKLKIYQEEDWFRFSLESILLPNFLTNNLKDKNIIDLCTGNAPIPMILSTKFNKDIYGVELQKEIYDLAKRSIEYNKIKNINLINEDVKNIEHNFNFKFDIITCNPPYFKINSNSKVNDYNIKAIARHEIFVNLEDIMRISSKIINDSGSLYLVHRCERFVEILYLFKKYNFGLRKLQFVYDNKNANSCFLLVEGKYKCKDDLKVLNPLFIDEYLEVK